MEDGIKSFIPDNRIGWVRLHAIEVVATYEDHNLGGRRHLFGQIIEELAIVALTLYKGKYMAM